MYRSILFAMIFIFAYSPLIASDKLAFPAVEQFNLTIFAGAELRRDVTWNNIPAVQLREGSIPAYEDEWEKHSAFTSSLFAVKPGETHRVRFMARSDAGENDKPTLWMNVHYYDKHGVLIYLQKDNLVTVPLDWIESTITLSPQQDEVAYAEIWFVKFSDTDESGKAKRSIYIAGLRPELD